MWRIVNKYTLTLSDRIMKTQVTDKDKNAVGIISESELKYLYINNSNNFVY